MEKKKTIDLDTKYSLPIDYTIVNYSNKYLIIAPECLNYIVLYTREQCEIYKLLYKHTIREVLEDFNYNKTDVSVVITQIEAKTFKEEKIEKLNNSFQMHLFLTNKCNLRCRHCYMFSGESYEHELTLVEIENLLSKFKSAGGRNLILSGGEVTTRNDFLDIVKYANNIDLKVSIMTNGVLWNDEMIIEASKYLNSVQVSIDGYNEEEYEYVRGKNNFKKAMNTIDKFLKSNIPTTVAITPWPGRNLSDKISDYMSFEKSLKDRYKDYSIMVKFTADIMDGRELNLSDLEIRKYKKMMTLIADGGDVNKRRNILLHNFKQRIIKDNWCTYGSLTVSANGDIYFCGKLQGLKSFGNLREVALDEIMLASKRAREISKIQYIYPCNKCDLRYVCGGDCRIKFIEEYKDCKNISNQTDDSLFYRKCSQDIKNEYYQMMLEINHLLYK